MKQNGFISMHRKLTTWEWHSNPSMMTVWTHLLLLAEYEDTSVEGMTIKRGQLLASQEWLAYFIGISLKQLRLCLEKLEEGEQITKKKANNKTLITIMHYNDYQHVTESTTTSKETKRANEGQTKGRTKGSMGINNNKYNNKNLSDGEIKSDGHSFSEEEVMDEVMGASPKSALASEEGTEREEGKVKEEGKEREDGKAREEGTVKEEAGQALRKYATALWQNSYWLNFCGKTYSLPLDHVKRYAIAFYEQMRTEQPSKTWLSAEDFCRHFFSWLKFQSPEKVKKYLNSFLRKKQQEQWRKAEEERQAEMWKEIEEAKKKAISYEEYLDLKKEVISNK